MTCNQPEYCYNGCKNTFICPWLPPMWSIGVTDLGLIREFLRCSLSKQIEGYISNFWWWYWNKPHKPTSYGLWLLNHWKTFATTQFGNGSFGKNPIAINMTHPVQVFIYVKCLIVLQTVCLYTDCTSKLYTGNIWRCDLIGLLIWYIHKIVVYLVILHMNITGLVCNRSTTQ